MAGKQPVEQIISPDKKYRVSFYQKQDGTFTYEQETFADDSAEQFWAPLPSQSTKIYPDLETAKREAAAAIPWFAST